MMNLLNDPLMALGAGLLDPNGTYGSFGAALNKGLLAGQQAQRMSQNAAFQKMQMEAYKQAQEREKEKQRRIEAYRERIPGLLGSPGGQELAGPRRPQFQGQSLLSQPTGRYASDPGMATLMQGLLDVDPVGVSQMMMQSQLNRKPKDSLMEVDDRLYNVNTGQWITPPGYGAVGAEIPEPPGFTDLLSWNKMTEKTMAPYVDAANAFKQLDNALLVSDNPYSSLAVITKFAKALDPESVVRGSEAETVAAANGLFERLMSLKSEAEGKGSMTQKMRGQIAATAKALQQVYADEAARKFERHKRLGVSQNVPDEWTTPIPEFADFHDVMGGTVNRTRTINTQTMQFED